MEQGVRLLGEHPPLQITPIEGGQERRDKTRGGIGQIDVRNEFILVMEVKSARKEKIFDCNLQMPKGN